MPVPRPQTTATATPDTSMQQFHQSHHLPAEIWADSLHYLLLARPNKDHSTSTSSQSESESSDDAKDDASNNVSRSLQPLIYPDLLQLSTVSRQFLHDVSPLVSTLHITSLSQLRHPQVAQRRYGPGVRQIVIDCLFEVKVEKQKNGKNKSQQANQSQQMTVRPNPIAYRHVASFLSSESKSSKLGGFPKLERVVLGGYQAVDRSLSFEDDGYTCREAHRRLFHPFHTQPGGDIDTTGAARIVPHLESFLRGETTTTAADGPPNALTSFVSAHHFDQRLQRATMKSNLICDLCDAYCSNSIPPTTHFPGLLATSCCPTRARNGGIILAGPLAESCEYCTRICNIFPVRDIKDVLLDPTSYEESVFDRILCMSTKKIFQILIERTHEQESEQSLSSVPTPLVDVNFVAQCLIGKRYAALDAIIDLNLVPTVDNTSVDEIEKALACNELKPEIPRSLFNRLVEGGLPLRPDFLAVFE